MIKKAGIITMALCLMLILMMACCGAKTAGSDGSVAGGAVTGMPIDNNDHASVDHEQAQPVGYEEDDDTVGYDICPCVMVKGVVYYDIGYKSTVDGDAELWMGKSLLNVLALKSRQKITRVILVKVLVINMAVRKELLKPN